MYVVIAYIVAWLLLTVISLCGDSNLIAVRFLMLIYQTDFFSPAALFVSLCMLVVTYYLKKIVATKSIENDIHMSYANKLIDGLATPKSNKRSENTKPHSVQTTRKSKAPSSNITNTRRRRTNNQIGNNEIVEYKPKKQGKIKKMFDKTIDYFLSEAPNED